MRKNKYSPQINGSLWTCFAALMLFVIFLAFSKNPLLSSSEASSFQTVTILPQADTFVSSGRSVERNPTNPLVAVGYETSGNYQILRTLLQFDLQTIPKESEIVSATLLIHLSNFTGLPADMPVTVQQVLDRWPENINWTEQLALGVDPNLIISTRVGIQSNWYMWDMTQLIQQLADNRTPSDYLGLILKGNETAQRQQRAFWSKDCTDRTCIDKRPHLRIAYNPPTPIPPSSTPTVPTLLPVRQLPPLASKRSVCATIRSANWPVVIRLLISLN